MRQNAKMEWHKTSLKGNLENLLKCMLHLVMYVIKQLKKPTRTTGHEIGVAYKAASLKYDNLENKISLHPVILKVC